MILEHPYAYSYEYGPYEGNATRVLFFGHSVYPFFIHNPSKQH